MWLSVVILWKKKKYFDINDMFCSNRAVEFDDEVLITTCIARIELYMSYLK